MDPPAEDTAKDTSLIIYDGDCIFCRNYVRLLRLREAVGAVELIDARSGDPRAARYWESGHDLDEGMLFVHRHRVYHGAEAVHVLAALSGPVSWFNRMNRLVFSSRAAATLLYPLLKAGRRITLFVRGKAALAKPERPAD